MSEKIKETLRKTAAAMSKETSPSSSNIEKRRMDYPPADDLPGEPDCPYCGGVGYLRDDVPIGHPNFGKLQVCDCRKAEISQHTRNRLYALSHLDELSHLSFENFKPRGRIGLGPLQADSLEQAYNHAQQFAGSLNGWLLIQGGFGCGKTHLAAAIANFVVSLSIPTLFITVPDLLDSLRFSYNDPDDTFETRFEEIRRSPLLILDDFGTQNATPWAQEKLFQILNYRYTNRLPLVVTTNLAMQEIESRIRSRLKDPELVTRVQIQASDYRNPTDDTGHHELSSLPLLSERSFGNFSLRKGEKLNARDQKSLDKAFKAAQAFADKPDGWLVLMGPYGSGKTHLAAAIANYRAGMGYQNLFVVVPDLLDHLRATFNPASNVRFDRLFDDVRKAPLLILDDLGTQSMTPWVREKLYQLFNHRYNAELATVITTADKMEEIDSRIRSRMLDNRMCVIHAITVPAFRGIGNRRTRRR